MIALNKLQWYYEHDRVLVANNHIMKNGGYDNDKTNWFSFNDSVTWNNV